MPIRQKEIYNIIMKMSLKTTEKNECQFTKKKC